MSDISALVERYGSATVKAPKRRKVGRPLTYSTKVATEVCELIAMSNVGLARQLKDRADLPSETTVMRWLDQFPEFREQYARARERQADLLVDEALEIADDTSGDVIMGKHGPMMDAEFVARSKLRVETRKWMAGKLAPKKYGEASRVELTGADGGPIQLEAVRATLIERVARLAPPEPEGEVCQEPQGS
ncbi:MAG TPA: hypothetical protein VG248_03515 [Caulobacteraceae bacterium]|nr:hypothetical protein [Caulobacteraceae bacterium]